MQVVEYFISAAALKLCRLLFFSNGRCEKEGMREFCQRCVPKSSNLRFLSFSAQNCSSYTLFLCDLKQCGSSAYSNKATWWFLIPRQENRIIWLRWKRGVSPKGEWTRVCVCGGGVWWTPCMCGKWFWQGLKLMISTCSLVANRHKGNVQTKAVMGRPWPPGWGDKSFLSRRKRDRQETLSLKSGTPEGPRRWSKPGTSEPKIEANHLAHETI